MNSNTKTTKTTLMYSISRRFDHKLGIICVFATSNNFSNNPKYNQLFVKVYS